ncbi:carbohydrate ABC transporter permease [Agromyces sp. SYSU T00194]|uniref:carbohydrate ABC transporter permease n=1 Tax=Agromyces chitinivorans TaxID=3158560 RepID=UPI003398045D
MTRSDILVPPPPTTEAVTTGRSRPGPRPAPRHSASARLRGRVSKGVLYVLLAVLSIPFLYPTLWMLFSSFKPASEIFAVPPSLFPQDWTLEAWPKVFSENPFLQQYFNSIYIAVIVTALTIVVSALAGYAFARIRFPFAGAMFLLLLSGIMLPSEVTVIPLFQWANSLGLIDTHWPLIVLPVFGSGGIVATFIFRQFFLSLPVELEEAGRLDGLGRMGIFLRIALPLAGPAVATVTILQFLKSFNLYFEAVIFLKTPEMFTVGLGLTRYQDTYGEPLWNAQLAATTLTVIPVLVVFLFAQRQFVESLSQTGLK